MRKARSGYLLAPVIALLIGAAPAIVAAQELEIALEEVAAGLTRPTDVTSAGDGSGRLFIVQQDGQILILEDGEVQETPFLDIASILSCCGERGLLGLAFHPGYAINGYFYVNYTDLAGDTVVARYEVSEGDPNLADPDSELVVLTFDQPFANHNGGQIQFGPDGYLYIATGDGGSGGDPQNHAQNLSSLLGKLLRIDVDGDDFPGDPERNYAIPPDNPFVGDAGLDEIWAYGLRNPWRFSFDRSTGDLWLGDVGQATREEINLQLAESPGGENYGWKVLEGTFCHSDDPPGICADFLAGGSTLPVLEYDRMPGGAVIGGFRYRGSDEAQLRGVYLYTDLLPGPIWGTLPSCEGGLETRELLDTPFAVTTFGEDEAGELHVVERTDTPGQSRLHRITVAPGSGGPVLTPDPDTIDFGGVGGTVEIVLEHTGTGADAVVIDALELSDTAHFSVDPDGGAAPCGAAPICLAPGTSCTMTVSFDPQVPGTFQETLTFDANSPPAFVTLLASLAVPELELDPPALDFGVVEVGTMSDSQISTLRNVGEAAATGLVFSLPGDFDADTGACGDTLPAGESCDIVATFSPTATGPASSVLTIRADLGVATGLGLSGHGVAKGAGLEAVALEVDTEAVISDGNDVFEPGETVEVAPAWRNDDTTGTDLEGTAADFTGPDGATYVVDLAEAAYGLVEPGQTASCRDTEVCYQLSVDDPIERPATRWAASFDETLSDGTTKTWRLPIGRSFTDVPSTSPFYRHVEILLHHEVTGGCTETTFCPGEDNTRGQMPVFVLRALEGSDFEPQDCTPGEEVFADVPASSAFCPWIEELYHRGVVAGCGDDIYCPDSPVNRQQLAVFLLRTLEGNGFAPPHCTGRFEDVPCPSPFADWVEELASREITAGCSAEPDQYCPTRAVNRQQMAVFLGATFELLLYGP